ncbi:MAG: PLP-dependent aspartate aminotransferase family protein [Holophaga sp.]|nr:PLP-dependent aspartate aminotransferase family protein [Holophaga sp.]
MKADFTKQTQVLHTGNEIDQQFDALSVPIYQVSTFLQDVHGEGKGFEYSRSGNPTRDALEKAFAVLEHGKRGLAFASGIAAISAVFMTFSSGDHFIVSDVVYGGTYRLLTKILTRMGMAVTFVDSSNLKAIEAAVTPQTKAVFVETPTNPMMKVSDIRAIAGICREHGFKFIVDNTFMSPYWQNPLLLGADIVVHSATKYLGGHSDVVAGLVVTATEEQGDEVAFIQNAMGGILGPQDSWLLMRGIKTLAVRMEQHERNANALAAWLETLPGVAKVFYPGLASHPQHKLAKAQAGGFGGMISFELTSAKLAEHFLGRLRLIALAISLGGVESLICLPAKTTHASFPPELLKKLGVNDRLVRLSVGIENVEELKQDILQAMA